MKYKPLIRRGRRDFPSITKIAVTGFKSIAERREIEIRPLTLLAGANSSGKSSIIQPLLLLKQTLEENYDPAGALLLNGPNVRYTAAEQLLTRCEGKCKKNEFTIEIESGSARLTASYVKPKKGPLDVASTILDLESGKKAIELTPTLTKSEIRALFPLENLPPDLSKYVAKALDEETALRRRRCFLELPEFGELFNFSPTRIFGPRLTEIIHLPGLRGNPERNYPLTAVGRTFRGTFPDYVASIIAGWEESHDKGSLDAVGEDLFDLGLTWKVTAQALNDAQVELKVGRLPQSTQGGAKDLVSIADVGVGVSQTLPIVVALHVARPGQMVYIEQPEIHLHPRAQAAMAKVLAKAAKRGVQVVIETHSDHLLLAIQTAIAEGFIEPAKVALHWFQRNDGITNIHTAEFDRSGAYGDWPADFGDVQMEWENRFFTAAAKQLKKAAQ